MVAVLLTKPGAAVVWACLASRSPRLPFRCRSALGSPAWATGSTCTLGGARGAHDPSTEGPPCEVWGTPGSGLVGGRASWSLPQRVPPEVRVGMRRAGPFAFRGFGVPAQARAPCHHDSRPSPPAVIALSAAAP